MIDIGRRARKYQPRPFESRGDNLSANIYLSMIKSKAWENLSNNAKVLYLYMKLQLYGANTIEGHPPEDFYFNTAMITQTYKLYTNMSQFRKDRQLLIDNGFIEIIENGRFSRTKNIYRLSAKWQEIK